jgi:transcriptional regulator with XRE-family HTH domain
MAALVGERVRAARQARGLSLGALAEAAKIGKGSLSELENGTRNPTLATLYALAGALRVPLATLLAERVGAEIGTEIDTVAGAAAMTARLVDVSHEAGTVEVYRLWFAAGARHRSGSHGEDVVEHLVVTLGRLRAGRSGEESEIGAGEVATWVSDVEHTYAALGDGPVEAVLVIRSPRTPAPGAQRP